MSKKISREELMNLIEDSWTNGQKKQFYNYIKLYGVKKYKIDTLNKINEYCNKKDLSIFVNMLLYVEQGY